MTGRPPPLLIVGHGTRDADGVAEFAAFVDRLGGRFRARLDADVAGGFIELSPPPLADAVTRLVGAGDSHLVVVPLVLVPAGHGKGDVPAAMAREQARHPGLSYAYGRSLWPHPGLLDLVTDRVEAALDGTPRAGTTVVLVGRGSTDPDANAEVAKTSRLLWDGRGYDDVQTAFISLARPSVPEAMERARLLGARRIVVAPYFLFSGVLPDRVGRQAREYAAEHPGLDVRIAGLLGDCDELADVVTERYHEAIAGDIRMNCDTCLYRVALPGHEHRVGAPQTPHHHPDDPVDGHHPHAHGHHTYPVVQPADAVHAHPAPPVAQPAPA
ncbi:MAG: sirohydrochlorin chelatase [Blastococcus sp.]